MWPRPARAPRLRHLLRAASRYRAAPGAGRRPIDRRSAAAVRCRRSDRPAPGRAAPRLRSCRCTHHSVPALRGAGWWRPSGSAAHRVRCPECAARARWGTACWPLRGGSVRSRRRTPPARPRSRPAARRSECRRRRRGWGSPRDRRTAGCSRCSDAARASAPARVAPAVAFSLRRVRSPAAAAPRWRGPRAVPARWHRSPRCRAGGGARGRRAGGRLAPAACHRPTPAWRSLSFWAWYCSWRTRPEVTLRWPRAVGGPL